MCQVTIKELKKDDFFTLKDYSNAGAISEDVVWIRGHYDRSSNAYSCVKFSDSCHERFFKGSKKVFTEFDF